MARGFDPTNLQIYCLWCATSISEYYPQVFFKNWLIIEVTLHVKMPELPIPSLCDSKLSMFRGLDCWSDKTSSEDVYLGFVEVWQVLFLQFFWHLSDQSRK